MKFRVLRNVWLGADPKTGRVKSCSKGDVLELGLDDLETIDSLVMSLIVTPIDNGLIPDTARYKCLYQFQEEINGETVKGLRNDEIKLPRDQATRLMAKGYIKPLDELAYCPGRPFRADKPTKKMYDEE